MPSHVRILFCPLLIAAAIAADEKTGGLPKTSPFTLRGGSATPATGPGETIEFAGVSSTKKRTDLIFYDKTAKKSHWIAPGETKEGISVLNYDERRDEAVVKVNGVQKTLALRKVAPPAGAARGVPNLPGGFNQPLPAALPAPVSAQLPVPTGTVVASNNTADPAANQPVPPSGSPAEIQKKQETEARMLVSDLLEIGMAQRRAYEEAQRKAADGTAQNSPTASSTTEGLPTQSQPNQPAR
jgi:hypothetical protein